jgi:hypothetical protein
MATLEQLERALKKADKAGDVPAAKRLAQEIIKMRAPPAPGYGEDMAKGFATGALQGAIGIPGGFGSAGQMTQDAVEGAAGYFGAPEWASGTLGKGARMLMGPLANLPTSEQITGAVEDVAGPMYEAKTIPGQYAQTSGQMLPTLLGPGSIPAKVGSWLGSSLASETAGQATKDSWAEPYARVAGGLLGGIGGGMTGDKLAKTGPVAKPAVKELDELQTAKNDAYSAVDNSGIRYSPQAYDDMLMDVDAAWNRMKVNPKRHDRAMAFVETLTDHRGRDLTLTELDQLRQLAYRDIVKGGDDANAAFGNVIIEKIDSMIDNVAPSGQVDASVASNLINSARDANKVYRASEKVMMKLDRADRQAMATGKGTNQDNALRQKTNELINENKGREFKKYPKDVQDKMNEIVRGTTGRNTARKIGMAAPTGAVSSTLMGGSGAAVGSAIGTVVGGPVGGGVGAFVGGVGVPAVGQVGKTIADRGTRKAVEDLLRIIQANGSAARAGVNQPTLLGQNIPAGLLGGASAASSPRPRSGQMSAPSKR